MRGVIFLILCLFMLALHLMLGTAMIEPVGEEVKTFVDADYDSSIDRVYDAYFKWSTIIWAGGAVYFAVRWYTTRERFTGRPPI